MAVVPAGWHHMCLSKQAVAQGCWSCWLSPLPALVCQARGCCSGCCSDNTADLTELQLLPHGIVLQRQTCQRLREPKWL